MARPCSLGPACGCLPSLLPLPCQLTGERAPHFPNSPTDCLTSSLSTLVCPFGMAWGGDSGSFGMTAPLQPVGRVALLVSTPSGHSLALRRDTWIGRDLGETACGGVEPPLCHLCLPSLGSERVPEARQMEGRAPGVCCGLDNLASYLSINPAGHAPSHHREPLQPGHSLVPLQMVPHPVLSQWQLAGRGEGRSLCFPFQTIRPLGRAKGVGNRGGPTPTPSPLFLSSLGDSSPSDLVSSPEWPFCSWFSPCFRQYQPCVRLLGAEPLSGPRL